MKLIYLDYAAATPLDSAACEAMQPYLAEEFYNPSSIYGAARRVRQAVDEARALVAKILGAKPTEIVFTSGGTESINLAIQGVLRAHPGAAWVTSAIEHDAVLAQRAALEREGHSCTTVPVRRNGIIDPAALIAAITDETVLVSLQLANNEIGTLQPVAQIAQAIAKIRANRAQRHIKRPLFLHTDAVQAANYLSLATSRLGTDLLSLSGSKIYGPKGSGLLYVRSGTELESLFYGGGQERDRRSGTENVAGIVGFATALEYAASERQAESKRLGNLRDDLQRCLQAAISGLIINGDLRHRLPNNLNVTIPGLEGQALVFYLDKEGILASTGSACSSGDLDPSHILLALGRTPAEAGASLRLTLGRQTTAIELDRLVAVLPGIAERLRLLQ